MGIPSYFSHLVKNHSEILKTIDNLNKNIHNFYLDSNSIIYDCVRSIPRLENETDNDFEEQLILIVCQKIEEYINIIKPSNNIIIAFDGVAPVAKLEQQRNRRYKSNFESKLTLHLKSQLKNDNAVSHEIIKPQENTWKLASITPGTNFMKKLSKYVTNYFLTNKNKFKTRNIIVSTSNEPGEGEHKLYEYIRTHPNKHRDKVTIVYGIDADLIMLCLNHLPNCKDLYLYRETPYFIKSLCADLEPEKCYLMNIPRLANIIISRMNNFKEANFIYQKNKLYDYIFLCFLLGNDFMPHLPYINIRTTGIDILMNTYSKIFSNNDKNITDGKIIYWNHFRLLIEDLANNEEQYFKDEYKIRNKWEKRHVPQKTFDEKINKFNYIPIKNREIEQLINPFERGWKTRYYKYLFGFEPSEYYIKKVCLNYLEALEWTFKYYTDDCYDWRWCYNYNYAPLFSDLLKYIPIFNTPMIEKLPKNPIHSDIQLTYVLPKDYDFLLNKEIKEKIENSNINIYPEELTFHWAFCKYFWECHVELPHINIEKLEQLIL